MDDATEMASLHLSSACHCIGQGQEVVGLGGTWVAGAMQAVVDELGSPVMAMAGR